MSSPAGKQDPAAAAAKSKDAKDEKKSPEPVKEEPKLTPAEQLVKDVRDNIALLKKGVTSKEARLIHRVLRCKGSLRSRMDLPLLYSLCQEYNPAAAHFLPDLMGVEAPPAVKTDESALPELRVFVQLLVILYVLDRRSYDTAHAAASSALDYLQQQNRRTLDLLSASIYYYYALTAEKLGQLDTIRNRLLLAHRTAALQHNEPGQVTLTNCILRSFLKYNLYDQADKFRMNAELPESRSNHEHARYLFYVGQLNAIQLHYSEAFFNLQQAIQKAPQKSAQGFQQQAHKLLVVVQLLMGDIPERSLFRGKYVARSLAPYLQLTQAVRVGDIVAFGAVQDKFKEAFVRDGVASLIARLRRNVVKTGLRKISLSYSRISMKDICEKLQFESEVDVEFIVAKGIRDGVVEAVIDRSAQGQVMRSRATKDSYSTQEPFDTFNQRITLANELRAAATKAMRYPADAHKPAALKDAAADDENNADPFEALGGDGGMDDED